MKIKLFSCIILMFFLQSCVIYDSTIDVNKNGSEGGYRQVWGRHAYGDGTHIHTDVLEKYKYNVNLKKESFWTDMVFNFHQFCEDKGGVGSIKVYTDYFFAFFWRHLRIYEASCAL